MMSLHPDYAHPIDRFGALLIDWILLFAVLAPLLYLLYGSDYWTLAQHNELSTMELFETLGWEYLLITEVLPILLIIFFWLKYQATPGKILFDCKIVHAETGKPISLLQSIVRLLGYLLSALPLGLGFLWALWDKRSQTWHDKLAGTVVVLHDEATKSLAQLEQECH